MNEKNSRGVSELTHRLLLKAGQYNNNNNTTTTTNNNNSLHNMITTHNTSGAEDFHQQFISGAAGNIGGGIREREEQGNSDDDIDYEDDEEEEVEDHHGYDSDSDFRHDQKRTTSKYALQIQRRAYSKARQFSHDPSLEIKGLNTTISRSGTTMNQNISALGLTMGIGAGHIPARSRRVSNSMNAFSQQQQQPNLIREPSLQSQPTLLAKERNGNGINDENYQKQQNSNKFSFEQFLEKVGTEDWYQIRTFSCFCMLWFVVGWFMISQNFLFQRVKFIDFSYEDSDSSSISQIEQKCNDGIFSMAEAASLKRPKQFYSISVEFNLFCDNEPIRQLLGFSQSLFGIFGYLLFGYLSDNYGRRHGLKLAWKMFTLGQLILCLTKVLPLVIAGYCLSSFAALAVIIIQISLINEQATGAVRVMSGIGLCICFSLSQAIYAGFAFIIYDWRVLVFVCGVIPSICLGFMIGIHEESPRYYYLKNKQKALRVLNKIAIINSKKSLNIDLERSTWTEESRAKNRKYKDLFRYLSVRISVLAGAIIYFSTELLYKSAEIAVYNNQTFTNYEKVLILASTDTCASVLTLLNYKRFGKKRQLNLCFWVSLLGLSVFYLYTYLLSSQIQEYTIVMVIQTIIAVITRMSSNYLRTLSFIQFAELFPTIIRSMGMSVLFSCAQLGSIVPFLMMLMNFNQILYLVPIIFCCIIAIIHVYWLPGKDTENQRIKDEIPEIAFGHDDKFYLDETEDS